MLDLAELKRAIGGISQRTLTATLRNLDGRVHIRHRLTPLLRDDGGHLGDHVIPPYRRRGHATAMLAASLPVAATLEIDCLLLTCDADNIASRKVIEANGGLFTTNAATSFATGSRPAEIHRTNATSGNRHPVVGSLPASPVHSQRGR